MVDFVTTTIHTTDLSLIDDLQSPPLRPGKPMPELCLNLEEICPQPKGLIPARVPYTQPVELPRVHGELPKWFTWRKRHWGVTDPIVPASYRLTTVAGQQRLTLTLLTPWAHPQAALLSWLNRPASQHRYEVAYTEPGETAQLAGSYEIVSAAASRARAAAAAVDTSLGERLSA